MRKTIAILVAALIACSAMPTAGESKSEKRKRLEVLERKIMKEIGVPRADDVKQCRSIGFGAKPCGGPWRYLVYSTVVSDVKKIERLVGEYNELNQKVNAEEGIASDCSFVGPPKVALIDGICKAR